MSEVAQAPEKQSETPATNGDQSKKVDPVKVGGPQKIKFHFKSRTEVQKVKDETTGKEVEKEVKIPKPDPIELELPLLTADDVAKVLMEGDEKQVALLLEAVNNVVIGQARSLVDEDVEKARTDGIDLSQLDWKFIANIPPATRRGGGIPDEVWEEFIKDYVEVMQHHGKTKEKAETGAKLLAKRFNPVKDNKKVVAGLNANLMVWFTNTSRQEDFQDLYEALTSKADTLLAKDEEAILAAI